MTHIFIYIRLPTHEDGRYPLTLLLPVEQNYELPRPEDGTAGTAARRN